VVVLLAGAGCGGKSQTIDAGSVSRYCDVARAHKMESSTNYYRELLKVAPGKDLNADIRALLANNDPEAKHYRHFLTFTHDNCGVDL
jgi:hypothetical protein